MLLVTWLREFGCWHFPWIVSHSFLVFEDPTSECILAENSHPPSQMKVSDVNLIGFQYHVIWLIQAEAQFPSWLHLWGTVPIMVTYLRHSSHYGYRSEAQFPSWLHLEAQFPSWLPIWGTVPIMVISWGTVPIMVTYLRHSSHHGYIPEAQFPSWLHLCSTVPIMVTSLWHSSHHGYISVAQFQFPSWLHLCSTVPIMVTSLQHSSCHCYISEAQFPSWLQIWVTVPIMVTYPYVKGSPSWNIWNMVWKKKIVEGR